MADLRVEDMNGVVVDGDIRTQGLMNFGTLDGDVSEARLAELRDYLGTVEAADAQRGPLLVEIAPNPSAAQSATDLEAAILADLRALARQMQTAIQPWVTEWEARGVLGVFGTFIDSVKGGLVAWWREKVIFGRP